VSFIVQKLLIRDLRAAESALRTFYISMMHLSCSARRSTILSRSKGLEGTLTDRQRKSVRDGVQDLFSEVNDTLREAAAIPSDRRPEPEEMLRLCQLGFEELFR
jgi:hypothetical protein